MDFSLLRNLTILDIRILSITSFAIGEEYPNIRDVPSGVAALKKGQLSLLKRLFTGCCLMTP